MFCSGTPNSRGRRLRLAGRPRRLRRYIDGEPAAAQDPDLPRSLESARDVEGAQAHGQQRLEGRLLDLLPGLDLVHVADRAGRVFGVGLINQGDDEVGALAIDLDESHAGHCDLADPRQQQGGAGEEGQADVGHRALELVPRLLHGHGAL
jgi:hypothetical protein